MSAGVIYTYQKKKGGGGEREKTNTLSNELSRIALVRLSLHNFHFSFASPQLLEREKLCTEAKICKWRVKEKEEGGKGENNPMPVFL
jgi:hypothetical protein